MARWGGAGLSAPWLYLFSAWDTAWYVQMANTLRFRLDRPFFPAYPILIRALAELLGDYWLSASIISLILGLACVPLFQAVAEHYMTRGEAFGASLIFTLFPFTFLFTTLAYSEPLFLLASLATWHLYRSGRFLRSLASASLASLSRPLGAIIFLPILLDLVVRKDRSKLLKTIAPLAAMALALVAAGPTALFQQLAFITTPTPSHQIGLYWFSNFLLPIVQWEREPMPPFPHALLAFTLACVCLFGLLSFYSYRVDWRLGCYASALFLVALGYGMVNGLLRYFSFAFPIWLSFKSKNPIVLLATAGLFYANALILWLQFLILWTPIA